MVVGTPNVRDGVGQSRVWDSKCERGCGPVTSVGGGRDSKCESVGQSQVCMVAGTPNAREDQ